MRQISGKGRALLSNLRAMNPAHLSAPLGSLFPEGAVAAELRTPGDPDLLLPSEAAHLGSAVPVRLQQFAAGRLCARRALAQFGIEDFPLRTADDRQPIWPPSLVGSITHTAGFCAAAVAERARILALGLDTEVVGDVNVKIWPSICTPAELAWVGSQPGALRPAAVTLIFSAKEAFYKCQYPLVGEDLNFHDARIEAVQWGGSAGVFHVHALRPLALAGHAEPPWAGRYLFHEGFVTIGIGLAAGRCA
jgi:4'-phosphopantetheinyl transferase EntD